MFLQLANQRVTAGIAGRQHHEGLDHETAGRVGACHYRRLGHRRMLNQSAFHFEWPDAVTGRQNDVVGAAHKPEIAVFIDVTAITGQIPVTDEASLKTLRVTAIVLEQTGRRLRLDADRDVAFLIGCQRLTVLVDDGEIESRHGFAHGTEARRNGRMIATHQHRFGLAVTIADDEPGGALPGLDDFRVERFAGTHAVTQMGKLVGRQILQHQHAIHGRRAAQGGDGIVREQVQSLLWVEYRRVMHEHRRAHVPRSEVAAVGGLGPAGVTDIPVHILRAQIQPVAAGDLMRQAITMTVDGHLGITRGA